MGNGQEGLGVETEPGGLEAGGKMDSERSSRQSGERGPRSQIPLMFKGTEECPVCGRRCFPKF